MKLRDATNIAAQVALLLGFLNGLVFFVLSILFGGTAFNGEYSESRFFLGASGELTEVSSKLYHYSMWHGIVVLILISLAIALTAVNQWLWSKERLPRRSPNSKPSFYDYSVVLLSMLFMVSLISMMIYGALI